MAVTPSRPGKRKCRECNKTFHSPDVEMLRTCPKCRRQLDSMPRIVRHESVRRASGPNVNDY